MNTRKGFTLVELLVVIAILAILATVSVVGYTTYISNANLSAAKQELGQIRDAALAKDITDGNKNGVIDADDVVIPTDMADTCTVEGNYVTYKVDANSAVIAYLDLATGKVVEGALPTNTPDPNPAPGEGAGE